MGILENANNYLWLQHYKFPTSSKTKIRGVETLDDSDF